MQLAKACFSTHSDSEGAILLCIIHCCLCVWPTKPSFCTLLFCRGVRSHMSGFGDSNPSSPKHTQMISCSYSFFRALREYSISVVKSSSLCRVIWCMCTVHSILWTQQVNTRRQRRAEHLHAIIHLKTTLLFRNTHCEGAQSEALSDR